jgi:hypothetical protein
MNPYILLALGLGWVASVGGSFFYGQGIGADGEIAKQAELRQAIAETREAAQKGAADAIAKLRPIHTTIKQETEREIRTHHIYTDCKLPPDGVRLANEALTGERTEPPSGGKLPSPDATRKGR